MTIANIHLQVIVLHCTIYLSSFGSSITNHTHELEIVKESYPKTSKIANYDVEKIENNNDLDNREKLPVPYIERGLHQSKGNNNEINDHRFQPYAVTSLATDDPMWSNKQGAPTLSQNLSSPHILPNTKHKSYNQKFNKNNNLGESIYKHNTSMQSFNSRQMNRHKKNSPAYESMKSRPKRGKDGRSEVLAGIIVPASGNRPFQVTKVGPALEKALEDISVGGWYRWNFRKLSITYVDSKCDVAIAMNEAIQLAERKRVSVFFGPVCDFALAPIARQAPYWNIPILTTGAIAYQFEYKKAHTYRTLTRLGPANFKDMMEFLEDVFASNLWGKLKIIYDSVGQEDVLNSFCHFLTEYTHVYLLSRGSNITMDLEKIDKQDSPPDLDHVMKKEVGTDHADKHFSDL